MTTAEELDQILDTWPEHNTKQEHEAIRAALHHLILKERREELQKIVDVINSWPTSEAGHFLLLHLEERSRHLTTESDNIAKEIRGEGHE